MLHTELKNILATLARTGEVGVARGLIEAIGDRDDLPEEGGSWSDAYWAAIRICEEVDAPTEKWREHLRDDALTLELAPDVYWALQAFACGASPESVRRLKEARAGLAGCPTATQLIEALTKDGVSAADARDLAVDATSGLWAIWPSHGGPHLGAYSAHDAEAAIRAFAEDAGYSAESLAGRSDLDVRPLCDEAA